MCCLGCRRGNTGTDYAVVVGANRDIPIATYNNLIVERELRAYAVSNIRTSKVSLPFFLYDGLGKVREQI